MRFKNRFRKDRIASAAKMWEPKRNRGTQYEQYPRAIWESRAYLWVDRRTTSVLRHCPSINTRDLY